jgi:hypothetical protein
VMSLGLTIGKGITKRRRPRWPVSILWNK